MSSRIGVQIRREVTIKIAPESIGVIHQFQLHDDLKRELLMFDRIAVCKHGPRSDDEESTDIAWLRDQGVIFDCHEPSDEDLERDDDAIFPLIVSSIATVNSLGALANRPRSQEEEKLRRSLINRYWHLQVRISAKKLRSDGLDAVPVLEMREMLPLGPKDCNDAVVRIVLRTLPEPDDGVSLDDILQFRKDRDTTNAFLRMRLWMSKLAKGELDPIEAMLTIGSEVAEYEEFLRRNKIKTQRGTLETVVVSSTEVLESLVKFKWSAAAEATFAVFKENSEFLEAEQKAPGRELAYIAQAHQEFDSTPD